MNTDMVTYEITFYREVEGQDDLDINTVKVMSGVPVEDVESQDRDSLAMVIEQARASETLGNEWVASQIVWNGELTIVPDNM